MTDSTTPNPLEEMFASPGLVIWQRYVEQFLPLVMEAGNELNLPKILEELTTVTQEIQTWGDETTIAAHDAAVAITAATIAFYDDLTEALTDV